MVFRDQPRILVCADAATEIGDVRGVLENARFNIAVCALEAADNRDWPTFQAVILDATLRSADCLKLCRRLHDKVGDGYLPILFITADPTPAARLASLESGADIYLLRPFDPAELLAQVRALLRNKERHDRLAEKTAEAASVNRQLQHANRQIDEELKLAGRIQESFLPRSLPQVPQVRFAVHYQPCGRVGGDFYDIFRLDEKHLGFYVADAMGHGVPASLLTIFVKTSVRAKEINGKKYRLVPPNEVLGRLNQDLIGQQLSDNPFVTMVYALFDFSELTLSFSRSGHPHPLFVPKNGKPELWPAEGSLLGVFDTRHATRTQQLQSGDKVLLYTDGIDAASFGNSPAGVESLLNFADKNRYHSIDDLIRQLPQELFKSARPTDDLTVLGLEVLDDTILR